MIDRLVLACIYFIFVIGSVSAHMKMKNIIKKMEDANNYNGSKCGIDNTNSTIVNEGEGNIEDYPWFGYLIFPLNGKVSAKPVVLVTKNMVIGSAMFTASLPKYDFRARAKVVMGTNCTGPKFKVKEYSYHPDFKNKTFSSLVLIQIDLLGMGRSLTPICAPPDQIFEEKFYAVSLDADCFSSTINIIRMQYVQPNQCKSFYRRSMLDYDSIWPKYTVCAKALKGGTCVWEGGVFLVMKKEGRWTLIGFGIPGPGCNAPARFLEYGMYHQWVRNNVQRIGRPSITRISQNQIIMRRHTTNLQKFGPCDPEEKYVEIYTDHTAIFPGLPIPSRAVYNFTILAQYEYSCIIFTASQAIPVFPTLRLKRLCLASKPSCHQFTTLQIDFEVEIIYTGETEYHVNVFGQPLRILDTKRMMVKYNLNIKPLDPEYLFQPTHYG